MTFEEAVETYSDFLIRNSREDDARQALLDFLDWEEAAGNAFSRRVRIVLVSMDFDKEMVHRQVW
jgi:hypothetical protein